MIYELNHFGIVVHDLEASMRFYEDIFGAVTVFEGFIPPSSTDVRYLQLGGRLIELLHPRTPEPGHTFGVTHIAFLSDALDADYADIVRRGYLGAVPPKVAGTGVGRLAFVEDPLGSRVELLERDVQMYVDQPPHPIVDGFDHYALFSHGREDVVSFYRDTIGLREADGPARAGAERLERGGAALELVPAAPRPDESAFAHIAVRVTDGTAAVAALSERGVAIDAPDPDRGEQSSVIGAVSDPDGVRIVLLDAAIRQPSHLAETVLGNTL